VPRQRANSSILGRKREAMSQKRNYVNGFHFQLAKSPLETVLPHPWHEPCLIEELAANLKPSAAHNNNHQFMRKFLLGLIAVAAVFLPLSQNAQAQWRYYHRYYYGYHHAYWHHRYWHHGYWYAGYWHPGYWYPGPVTVIVVP